MKLNEYDGKRRASVRSDVRDVARFERRVFEHTLSQIAKHKRGTNNGSPGVRKLQRYTSNLEYTKATLHHDQKGSEPFNRKTFKPARTTNIEKLDDQQTELCS